MSSKLLCLRFEVDRSYVAEILEGDVLAANNESTYPSCGDVRGQSDRFVDHIAQTFRKYLSTSDVELSAIDRLVVTTPGAIDPGQRVVLSAGRLGIHDDADLASELERQFQKPAAVFNDADCIAAFEHGQAGLPAIHLVLTVGLGIGSTLILNGKTYRGAGHAGHIGRAPLVPYSSMATHFYLEDFASQAGIVRTMRRVLDNIPTNDALLPDGLDVEDIRVCRDRIRAYGRAEEVLLRDVKEAVTLRDPAALQIVDEAARFLAGAVATAILHVNPNTITFVGDVFEIPGFWESLKAYAHYFSWPEAYASVDLRRGESGRRPQFLGCALLARDHFP
jgi:predicted NBD/HSP70 family sugar kinase